MNENITIHQTLCKIQKTLKVGKEHNNSFGKYKYRKAEDILKEVKSLLVDDEYVTTSAKIQVIQDRFYVEITACLHKGLERICAVGYARESFEKKGMDDAQLTGATMSYAKKYALCNLFAIDDEVDNDDEEVQKNSKQNERNANTTKQEKPTEQNTQQPIKTKEEAKAVVEKIDFEKSKENLMQTKDMEELKKVFTYIYNKKSSFTPTEYNELETIKNNKKEHFEN